MASARMCLVPGSGYAGSMLSCSSIAWHGRRHRCLNVVQHARCRSAAATLTIAPGHVPMHLTPIPCLASPILCRCRRCPTLGRCSTCPCTSSPTKCCSSSPPSGPPTSTTTSTPRQGCVPERQFMCSLADWACYGVAPALLRRTQQDTAMHVLLAASAWRCAVCPRLRPMRLDYPEHCCSMPSQPPHPSPRQPAAPPAA